MARPIVEHYAAEILHNDVTTTATSLYRHSNYTCAEVAPRSSELLTNLGWAQLVLVLSMLALTLATLAIYIEQIIFIFKAFRISERRKKTVWILAFFPVFSVCSFIGILVPKSGPLVHMCANLFFCTCLYQLMRLTVSYMGGAKKIWTVVEKDRHLQLNTLPLCCCCLCCPTPVFNRRNFMKVTALVLQIAIVRPLVMFVSAVLWTDSIRVAKHNQVFTTGEFNPRRSFVWLATLNVISTCLAVYGLVLMSRVLEPELGKDFRIRGKIVSIQGTLILTVIANLVIGGLVAGGVIGCTELLPAKVRGEEIYFCTLVIMMFPFSLVGRKNYRRISDGNMYATGPQSDDKRPIIAQNGEHVTETKEAVVGETSPGEMSGCEKDVNLNNYDKRMSVRIDLSDSKTVEHLMSGDEYVV